MKPDVALIVETSSAYGRAVLTGILEFTRTHEDWRVFLEQRDLQSTPPQWLNHWHGSGIISRRSTPELLESVEKSKIPLVDLTDRFGDENTADVRSDDDAIGAMAAEHLLQRGFRSFGVCGFVGESWSNRRRDAFVRSVAAQNAQVSQFDSPWLDQANPWDEDQERICKWVVSLPKPCGILTTNDLRGRHVLDAALQVGLRVPEEIAVIGVDNDELLCQFSHPPLSSVVPDAQRVGFLAAEMLSQRMKQSAGYPSNVMPRQIVPPLRIETRASTDIVAIDHPEVAAALAYIREHACEGLTVDQVLEHVDVSRSTLERQIRRLVGRTPQQEIRYVQIKKVCELLETTDLAAEQISSRAGFDHPEYMYYVFKRDLGITPRQYRLSVREK